ncbi:MAG: hypothetical protein R3258_03465 [Acidimicrobiia bacterium]|nr:hypothetical protein [Acidimicrobiia bacterium]
MLLFSTVTAVGARGSFGFSGGVSIGSVTLFGVGVGVANTAVTAEMSADVSVSGVCINNGSNKPDGVNDTALSLAITDTFVADDNGRIVFTDGNTLVIEDPVNDDGSAPKLANEAKICKNKNWTFIPSEEGGIQWGIVTVTFHHSSGTQTKTYDCTGVALGGTCPEI